MLRSQRGVYFPQLPNLTGEYTVKSGDQHFGHEPPPY